MRAITHMLYLIADGCGIISIPIEHQPEFTRMLVEFYESGEMEKIKAFVYENGIDGIDFRQNESQAEGEEFSPTMTM